MMISFRELLQALPDVIAIHGDTQITAPIVESSLDVQPGGVFVARKGLTSDGHDYILQAIQAGAAAIVGERPISTLSVPYAQVADAQSAIGRLAAMYYGLPSRQLVVIGVTGTDGKTTTSTLIHSILKVATDGKAGYISTISADLGDATEDTGLHVTTPGAPRVQYFLAKMLQNGLTHCVLEMTSHGLAQGRLSGVDIDVAVITNLTHEHLDYHGTFENYRAAKGIMFEMLRKSYRKPNINKTSVVNMDDPNASYYAAFPADQLIQYGFDTSADVRCLRADYRPDGTYLTVQLPDSRMETCVLNLVGAFNVSNALAAISVGFSLGVDFDSIRQGLRAVKAIPGRMERIDEGQDFTAIVDFAHTPNALKNALEAARTMLPDGKRLIAVFGSAGLRDVEKRRMMAQTSAQLADITVLTAEDPRTEPLDDILQMMAEGCLSQGGVEGETFVRVPDRGEALYRACQMAQPGDIVIACGKGHEQSMCFGTIEYPWDDREAMRAALRGTPLMTLPTAQ
ncbi:MAG: UDP-N-acetylmuramoyl-L-alanyl-D-glutamate--2,6-diaminopimelate ligase [Chloroflexi bacterium]|nr:MAG: UDP-N-acetylmuramoyl-L-alanyl-D-glutamate--2,6-diaminopimelate ligase [Chloroflexota bacterium]